ncbi:MAG: hypothetical protein IIY06_03175, partial [Proteobacteria bacterium]|nr:hypothetical protein [Pseudomonadota bacterium]
MAFFFRCARYGRKRHTRDAARLSQSRYGERNAFASNPLRHYCNLYIHSKVISSLDELTNNTFIAIR